MSQWLRWTLVAMSIGGGILGILQVLFLLGEGLHGIVYYLLLVLFVLMYVYILVSGIWFLKNGRRKNPLMIALAIQVPVFSMPLISYRFAGGLFAFLTLSGAEEPGKIGLHLGWTAMVGSVCRVSWSEDNPWLIGVNLVALGLLILLGRETRKLLA